MKSMSMEQFLKNPTGKSSAAFARRDLTIANLESRFIKLVDEHKKFDYEVYKNKSLFYFVFKVPSETKQDLFYDVVIEFSPKGMANITDYTIASSYDLKLFSNSPNFLFTYAYVYNEDDMIIDFLKDKISKKALTEKPDVRNPTLSYGFEKSVYFALLYIKRERLYVKSKISGKAKKLPKEQVKKDIKTTSLVLKKYGNKLKKDVKEDETLITIDEKPTPRKKSSNTKIEMKRDMSVNMKRKMKK